jgi:cobalt-zinc-cadmium resistance protein CzcA
MLDKIIHYSIRNKLVIGLFTLGLVVWGTYSLTRLPIDALPDITNNQVQIITVAPSQSALDIERLVTFPVEQTMATIPGITESRSFSRFGLSVVTIVFRDDIDVYWARQQVSERLTAAANVIPPGVGIPELAPVTTGLGEIFQYILRPKKGYEDKYTPMDLRTVQDWMVRRQLLGTEGVADVASFGGYLKQYEIAIDPDKLRSYNLGISDIFAVLEVNNQNTGGAYIDKKPTAYFIRSEGLINSADDIGSILIIRTDHGMPVLVRDVAEVRIGHSPRFGAMTYNNQGEVVGAVVMMLKGENSSAVVERVKVRMQQISKTLPEGLEIDAYLDRSTLVSRAIGTVEKNLIEGALIVIAVLVLFLGNLRAGLIVASVIPLAMLFAVSMMQAFGVSGNLMSLGAIDFGLIVDGAVIIVEATMHHLGLRTIVGRMTQQEMDDEIYASASKIRTSAAFGEIIILIVYLPILALVGVEGKMFRPMAQTVSFAILGAFILSLTYVPMMAALLLNKDPQHKRNFSDRMMEFFHRIYEPSIRTALKLKVIVVGTAVLLFVFTVILFANMGGEFLPTLDEGDFAVETRVLPGSSLTYTIDMALKGAEVIRREFPDEVRQVVGKVGTSEIPTDPMPIDACDLIIVLRPRSEWKKAGDREELAEKMAEALEIIPGVTFGFQQPIQMRFNELMTGVRQDVAVKVYGEDLETLSALSDDISHVVRGVKGVRDLYVEQVTGLPQIVISIDRDAIAKHGLSINRVNQAIKTAFAGQSAGMVYEGEKRFDLVVRLAADNRGEIDDVRSLFISTPDGGHVPLEQLANVQFKVGPNQIQREDAKRRIIVGFNVRGRDIESVLGEVQDKIDALVDFPPGYYADYGGQFENLREARKRLAIAVPAALVLILILLFLTFHSIRQTLLIFSAIPMAATGGVFALLMRGMPFSISAGVGFIALFGVAVLNGIVLIAEFNRLRKLGIDNLEEVVMKGTSVRLRPVLMTGAVASLGFLPMALSASSGAEVQRPLATVVIGGLITCTLLTLLVLPCLYVYFERVHLPGALRKGVAVLIAFCGLTGTAWGQQHEVTIDSVIQLALKNNKSIHAATAEVEYWKHLKRTSTDIGKTNLTLMQGQYNSYESDNNLTITQSIPFPSVFISLSKLGRSLVEAGELKKAATENELVFQVKQVYYQLRFLRSREELLQQQDSIYAAFLSAADARYRAGEARLLERTAAETQRLEIKNQLSLAQADIRIYHSLLKTLTMSEEDLEVDGSLRNVLEVRSMEFGLDSVRANANPQLQYLQKQVAVSEGERKVAGGKFLPDLTVGYFNQTLIGTFNTAGERAGGNQRFDGFMFGVSIPIWFVPQAERVKAARANETKTQLTYEHNVAMFKGEWERAVQQYNKSRSSAEYYRTSAVQNAALILSQASQAFRAGEIDYMEYLLAVRKSLEIRENYLVSVNNLNQSIINLEFLAGIH